MAVKIKNPQGEPFLRINIDNNIAVIKLNGEDMDSIHFETPFGTVASLNDREKEDLTEAILRKLATEGLVFIEESKD